MNNLSPGTRLGPYEVLAPAGAGGMGEVWRARDTRLERSVAIKVLPSEFATNAQLRMRFEREAKSISQLNHPNICTLYDVGEHEGSEYLVMEFIEGESLADRLARGPLPLDQVIRYGVEIAGALHRAHTANIVHRDLKPGNVMITKAGAKLLDFGLAKDGQPPGAIQEFASLQTEKRSLTEEGTIVGTFQYMAPEQLEGQPVDHRADIFALGALLYEMATGRRAFAGKSRASLIASILATEPPPISTVQPLTPPALERVIRTCLLKDPDERFQSAHDVRLELEWVAASGATAVAPEKRRSRRETLAWALTAVLAIAAGLVSIAFVRYRVAARSAPPIRTSIVPPDGTTFDFTGATGPPTISPDGKKIVFSISSNGVRQLWIRSLHSSVSQPLSGTEGAMFPFWSPDSRFIAFFADEKLKKIEAGGGAAVSICDAPDGRGGSWSREGVMLFGGRFTPLSRVSAAGGLVTPATSFDPAGRDVTHRWPRFLPDGRHFFYLTSPVGSDDSGNAIWVGSLDDKALRKRIVYASSQPMYFDGHLLFVRDGILVAQRFDAKSLSLTGDPMTLSAQEIGGDGGFSRRDVSIADDGTLVYQAGATARTSQIMWFDRAGKAVPALEGSSSYGHLRVTANGHFAVVAIRNGPGNNLWLADLQRGVKTRLTFGRDASPVWSPDGKKIAFSARPKNFADLHVYDLSTGADEALLVSDIDKSASCWSPDGRTLLYTENNRTGSGSNIRYLTLPDRKSHVYLETPSSELLPMISPDGRWLAYQSNASGRWEVYVAPFPPTGARWQVSTAGGVAPRWRRDGGELFFAVPDGARWTMTAVKMTLAAVPQIGPPVPLFRIVSGVSPGVAYDIAADGRFLVNARMEEAERPAAPLTLVQNFASEIRAAAARSD